MFENLAIKKARSDCTIQTAWSKKAYPENVINLGWKMNDWIHHLYTCPQGVDDIFHFFHFFQDHPH